MKMLTSAAALAWAAAAGAADKIDLAGDWRFALDREDAGVAAHWESRALPDRIRIGRDHVLEEMIAKLGAKVVRVEAPFDPEPGAYAGEGHSHRDHEHTHGHDHGHSHARGRRHDH